MSMPRYCHEEEIQENLKDDLSHWEVCEDKWIGKREDFEWLTMRPEALWKSSNTFWIAGNEVIGLDMNTTMSSANKLVV